ncbi:MAG: hypothetical protein ACK5V3_16145 [Bdellovibrionales bacterium]
MKNSVSLMLPGLIALTGLTANAITPSECPVLAGRYEADGDEKTIIEKRSGSFYQVTLGEGAFEITVNGKVHSTPDGVAQYQAWCSHRTLHIKVSAGGESGLMQYYFTSPQVLVEENSGMENSKRNWRKK